MNIYKTSLGAALMLASAQTASADNASAPTTLIGMDAMTSFFTCATKAMSAVSGHAVTFENALSELGTNHMRVSAENIQSTNINGTVSLSVEWALGKGAAPVEFFDGAGELSATFAIVEPPSHGRFGSSEQTVTHAEAIANGQRRMDVAVGGNANSNSMLRRDVATKAEDLVKQVRACAMSKELS